MKRTRGKSHSGEGAKKGKQVQDARRVQQQADISVDEKKGRCDQDGSDQGSESHTRQTSHQQHGVDQKKRETAKLWSVSAGAGASEVPRVELEGLWRRGRGRRRRNKKRLSGKERAGTTRREVKLRIGRILSHPLNSTRSLKTKMLIPV